MDMIKEMKLCIKNIKEYFKKFKKLGKKDREKSIMLIIYLIFFDTLLVFPYLLVREIILYFMTVYHFGDISLVSNISFIIVQVFFIITTLIYFPKNFNKRIAKKYIN